MRIEAYALTDPGPVREQNEDFFDVLEDEGLFLLADGMGGHAAGEVAAKLAVETVRDVIMGELDPDETRLDRVIEDYPDMLRERMRYAMNQASLRIRQEALANPSYAGMGTTLVVCLVEDGMDDYLIAVELVVDRVGEPPKDSAAVAFVDNWMS